MNQSLKDIRLNAKLTQIEAARLLNISLRSYKEYEKNSTKWSSFKYIYICDALTKATLIDEEHGVLTIEEIIGKTNFVFKKYNINFVYLFGSYSKKKATPKSDIDLLLDSDITGLDFFGLIEELRNTLHKEIDLLKTNQLEGNLNLLKNVLKDGIKIYG